MYILMTYLRSSSSLFLYLFLKLLIGIVVFLKLEVRVRPIIFSMCQELNLFFYKTLRYRRMIILYKHVRVK